jgi:hypothetical protein
MEAYAAVEGSLAVLLGVLLNDAHAASSIFFRIANTKSRNLIIEDILRQRHGETYSHYWHGIPGTKHKGLMNIIQALDGQRNEIVHWRSVREVGDGTDETVLMPPNFWLKGSSSKLTTEKLMEFGNKADFACRSLNMFVLFLGPVGDDDFRTTWREIFLQPCSYPPPDSHRLSRNYKAPQSPPQPSGA